MKNLFEYILFLSLSKFFRFFDLKTSRKFSAIITFVFYYLIPIRKKTVISNLKIAFPNYSDAAVRQTAYKCYKSFVVTLIEILYIPKLSADAIKKIIDFENIDFINESYKQNKGLILLTAHFGNWEYMGLSLALNMNALLNVVFKPQRNVFVTKWMNKQREKFGNKTIQLGMGIREVYQTLKEKKITAMVADQRGPSEGVRVFFFGRKVSVYPGPAALSVKTGAPILIGAAVRQKDYSYKVVMQKINMSDLPENYEDKIREISQRHTLLLEELIKEHPEQWLWMHKRWKY